MPDIQKQTSQDMHINSISLFDSHCHLDFEAFDSDRALVLKRCLEQGISAIMIPAVSRAAWSRLFRLLEDVDSNTSMPSLYGALGLHPWFAESHSLSDLKVLDNVLQQRNTNIVAVGEIGLDYWVGAPDFQLQDQLFSGQLELAARHNLPVIIHARKSHDQVLKRLRSQKASKGGIVHAFSGSEQQAHQYIELGFKLGLGGGITYPRATKTRKLAASLPLDAIVLETDAPDMPLNGFQGERNTPERLPAILQALNDLREESIEEIATATYKNTEYVFNTRR